MTGWPAMTVGPHDCGPTAVGCCRETLIFDPAMGGPNKGISMNLKKLGGYSVFLHLVLVALAVQVVFLVNENKKLITRNQPPQLAEGEQLEPMPVQELGGPETVLSFGASQEETVLLVYTTTCPVCEENQVAWRELYDRFDDHYNILGISIGELESSATYASAHSLPFPVFVPTQPQGFSTRYKIPAVPQTIHLDRDGKVKNQWAGPLPQESFDQLAESTLGSLSEVSR